MLVSCHASDSLTANRLLVTDRLQSLLGMNEHASDEEESQDLGELEVLGIYR